MTKNRQLYNIPYLDQITNFISIGTKQTPSVGQKAKYSTSSRHFALRRSNYRDPYRPFQYFFLQRNQKTMSPRPDFYCQTTRFAHYSG